MAKHFKLFFALLIALGTMGQIASDLYLPSLPHLISDFNTSNSLGQISVALYMAGFTSAQLIYGLLSDGVGRRKSLLAGLLIFITGSLFCSLATSIYVFIFSRLLQGLGSGAAVVLSRAILRDVFSHGQLAKFMSLLSIGAVSMMASAPMFGGYLQYFFGWQMSFYLLLVYGVVALACAIVLVPETNEHMDPSNLHASVIVSNLKQLFRSRVFVGGALISSLSYSGFLAWLTAGPIIIQTTLGFSSIVFGWLAFAVAASYCVTAYINSRIVSQYQFVTLIRFGLHIMFAASLLMFILYYCGLINVYVIVIPMVFFSMSTAFTFVNCFAQAFEPFPKIAGIATAVYSFIQMGGGFISSSAMAYFHEVNQLPLASWLITISVACIFIRRMAYR